jgi:DNA-binding transcriptional regulator YdaS (Cro superfamily)
MNSLATAAEIIEAFGGTFAFARATGVSPKTVSNWKKNGLPAARFPDLEPFLRSQGIKAATSAFSFRQPTKQAAE